MKLVFGFLVFNYILLFAIGYIPTRIRGAEKSKAYCESVMDAATQKLWFVMLFGAGDANACLDMGYMPLREPSQPSTKESVE